MHGLKCSCDLIGKLGWYIYFYGRICDDEFFALDKISFNDKIYLPTGIELSIQECSGIDSEQISSPELNFQREHVNNAKQEHFNHKISHYGSENIYSEHFANPKT